MDTISRARRSDNMRRIRARDTKPELIARSIAHCFGCRFRLHGAWQGGTLPGKPDMVFAARRKVIFVHGCFWHMHGCDNVRIPKSNQSYWRTKLRGNQKRGLKHLAALKAEGWKVLVVWECEIEGARTKTEARIKRFLLGAHTYTGSRSATGAILGDFLL